MPFFSVKQWTDVWNTHGVCLGFLKPYTRLFPLFYNFWVLSLCKVVYVHLMGWWGRQLSHICHLSSSCSPPGCQPLPPCLGNGGEKKNWREKWGTVPKKSKSLPAFLRAGSLSCHTFNILHLEKPPGLIGLFLHRLPIPFLDSILFGNGTDHTDPILDLRWVQVNCFLNVFWV